MNEDSLNDPEYLRDALIKAIEYIELLKIVRDNYQSEADYYKNKGCSITDLTLQQHELN